MFDLVETKSVQTSILAAVLFYFFANKSTFKKLRKFPGLKFVMKGATEITHSGVVVNAILFGTVLFLCVYLINISWLGDYLNIVEGYREHVTKKTADNYRLDKAEEAEARQHARALREAAKASHDAPPRQTQLQLQKQREKEDTDQRWQGPRRPSIQPAKKARDILNKTKGAS
jgi:hypothetical protein